MPGVDNGGCFPQAAECLHRRQLPVGEFGGPLGNCPGGAIRRLYGMDLEEGVSTRLLIYAATLINAGMPFDQAIEAAIIEPLSDDADIQQALRDLVAVTFG